VVSSTNRRAGKVLEGMNTIVAKLMEVARARLLTLVQITEVNDLDRAIGQLAREGHVDMALLKVLDTNIEAANKDGAVDRSQFFTHIRTRCVEEMEKQARPADALISRALRQTDPGIRGRILEDALLPKAVVLLPSGKELVLDTPAPPKVTIGQFADAVADAVARLQALGVDGDLVADAVQDIRSLSKDVRAVVMQHYDEEKVRWLELRLGEVFAPVLSPSPREPPNPPPADGV